MFHAMAEGAAICRLLRDVQGNPVDYRVLSANPAFGEHLGIPAARALGSLASEVLQESPPPLLDMFAAVVDSGKSRVLGYRSRDGQRYFMVSAFALPDGLFGAVFQNVTEQHRVNERERRRQDELVRTAGLLTVAEMSSAIAHELNQPLAAIAAYADGCVGRLQSGVLRDEDLDEVLREIGGEARRAAEVLRGIRRLARNREHCVRPVDLNDTVRGALGTLEFQRRALAAMLQFDAGADLPPALADPVLLEVVVVNLLRNALEELARLPEPERRLVIATAVEADGGLRLSVRDSGGGVPVGSREDVFKAFYTTKPGGLGLGLSISRSIAEALGGRLSLEEGCDGGACFHLSLRSGAPT